MKQTSLSCTFSSILGWLRRESTILRHPSGSLSWSSAMCKGVLPWVFLQYSGYRKYHVLEHCIIRRFDEAMFQNSFSPTGWLHCIYTQYCVWGFPLYNIRYKCFFLHGTLITERLHFSQSYRLLVILCNGIITTIIGGTALQDVCMLT